jgi:hypothetical protein
MVTNVIGLFVLLFRPDPFVGDHRLEPIIGLGGMALIQFGDDREALIDTPRGEFRVRNFLGTWE